MLREVNTIPGAEMQPKFADAAAHRTDIAQIARCQALNSDSDAGLGRFVAYPIEPVGKWNLSILSLVAKQFHSNNSVA